MIETRAVQSWGRLWVEGFGDEAATPGPGQMLVEDMEDGRLYLLMDASSGALLRLDPVP